jgi:prepilin-type N-terminal cleavage/methylation domain-containing protein
MLKDKSGGFTLIEVTIVLAITAGMVSIIFAGQQEVRTRTNFTNSVNNTVSDLDGVRNAVQTGNYSSTVLNNVGSDNATSTGRVIWGALISAPRNSPTIKVTYIVASGPPGSPIDQTAPCSSLATNEYLTAGYSYDIKLGANVMVQNGWQNTTYIVLHRTLCGGQLQTFNFSEDDLYTNVQPVCPYDSPALGGCSMSGATAAVNYISNPFVIGSAANAGRDAGCDPPASVPRYCYHNPYIANLRIVDSNNHFANLTFDGTQNSSITRSIQ